MIAAKPGRSNGTKNDPKFSHGVANHRVTNTTAVTNTTVGINAAIEDREAGEIVIKWLVKIVLVLAVFGVLAFDGISIGLNRLATQELASKSAQAARDEYASKKNFNQAYEAAVAKTREENNGSEIDPQTFKINPDGSAEVDMTHTAPTLIVGRISPIKHWAVSKSHSIAYTIK